MLDVIAGPPEGDNNMLGGFFSSLSYPLQAIQRLHFRLRFLRDTQAIFSN